MFFANHDVTPSTTSPNSWNKFQHNKTHNSSSITSRARGHEPAFKLPPSFWGATNLNLYKAVDIEPICMPQIQSCKGSAPLHEISRPRLFKEPHSIYRINRCPENNVLCLVITCPLDGDLSGGQRYPHMEQPSRGMCRVKSMAFFRLA